MASHSYTANGYSGNRWPIRDIVMFFFFYRGSGRTQTLSATLFFYFMLKLRAINGFYRVRSSTMYCHDGWEGEVVIGVHSFRLIAQHVMLFDQPDIPILSSTDTSKRSVVISGSNSRGNGLLCILFLIFAGRCITKNARNTRTTQIHWFYQSWLGH